MKMSGEMASEMVNTRNGFRNELTFSKIDPKSFSGDVTHWPIGVIYMCIMYGGQIYQNE